MNEEELKALQASNPKAYESYMSMKAENDKLKNPPKPDPTPKPDPKPTDDPTLKDKADKERKEQEERANQSKRLESAIAFNMNVANLVKDNADALPNEIKDILAVAEKEKYDSAAEKAGAIKTAMIQSFFAVQANVDLLTKSQKSALDDFLKLTKNGKEQKAETVFENLFEPTLEMLKRVKKAEELGRSRSGHASGTKVGDAYKARLQAASRKTYLGEKGA